jgi:hypothetical protein
MNLSWLHLLLVERANHDSLPVAVEHFENFKRKTFSAKKDVVLRHGALVHKTE